MKNGIVIKKFVWDQWNLKHIEKHHVEVKEIEAACKKPLKTFASYKGRLLIVGKTTEKRLLTIVLTPKNKNSYYVVTARDTSQKERMFLK